MHSTRLFEYFLQVERRRKSKNQKLAKKDKKANFDISKFSSRSRNLAYRSLNVFYQLILEGHTTVTRCILNPETDFLRLNYVLEFQKNDENPDYIIFRFGYNACPLACKVCVTDTHEYCSKVVRISKTPTRKLKSKAAVESKS